jgi:beta-ketodecanoyl-[acyl-carrier-protein] synthase
VAPATRSTSPWAARRRPWRSRCAARRSSSAKAKCALAVTPELTSGFINWRDRDSHFIFGDASVAVVVEPLERQPGQLRDPVDPVDGQVLVEHPQQRRATSTAATRARQFADDKLFYQQGRRVFKDVVPLAAKFIGEHLATEGVAAKQIARFWLHQANENMNALIAQRLIGREPSRSRRR